MRPCPNCECFVSVTAKRCPRCEAALEPIERQPEPQLALVGAPAATATATTTDPIVRSVVAQVALPKLPQPFDSDPAALAVFLGVPARAPEPAPLRPLTPITSEPRPTDEPAADLSPATIAAIADAAAEIAASTTTLGTDAALDRVIARANELADRAPTHGVETAPEPESHDEPPEPPPSFEAPASTIVATPLAPPVVLTVPESTPKPPRRKWLSRRDAFTRRFNRRERVLARTCVWLLIALAVSVLALRLPLGSRPELGATTTDTGGEVGTAATPVTSPFADVVRLQTQADLRVVVGMAGQLHAFWKSYVAASPSVLSRELPQFAFVRGALPSARVGQLSVAAANTSIVLAEYAGPKACAYARLVAHQNAQVVIGATATACRATTPPAQGWSALGAG